MGVHDCLGDHSPFPGLLPGVFFQLMRDIPDLFGGTDDQVLPLLLFFYSPLDMDNLFQILTDDLEDLVADLSAMAEKLGPEVSRFKLPGN